jgi:hypothetical protein
VNDTLDLFLEKNEPKLPYEENILKLPYLNNRLQHVAKVLRKNIKTPF